MTRIALFGATGNIGGHVLTQALEAGHEVRALVRDPARLEERSSRLTIIQGDVADPVSVGETISGAEAVIAAVGPRSNTPDQVALIEQGARNIVDQMRRHGVRRLVAISGGAVDMPGERKPIADRLISRTVRRFARHIVAAKQREFEIISASDLDWTAVRPPRVVEGPRTGRYRHGAVPLGGRTISRADVADFMLRQLEDPMYVRHAPFVAS